MAGREYFADVVYLGCCRKQFLWEKQFGIRKENGCFFILLFFLIFNLCNTKGHIMYLNYRPVSEKCLLEEKGNIPWIVFYDSTDWVFHCSLYDFTIPEKIKRVSLDSEPEEDDVIKTADEIIIYLDEEQLSIEEAVLFLENSSFKSQCEYEKVGNNYKLSIYRCF